MRTLLIFLLSCFEVFGGDPDIHVATTVRTNASGRVSSREVFTRSGQTNLVRDTAATAGVVEMNIQRFYRNGSLVGEFIARTNSSGFLAEAGTPYSLFFEFDSHRNVRSAIIGTKDGVVLDWFSCTNGNFNPVENSLIQKANGIGADMKQLFDPAHVKKTSPGGFGQEVKEFIEKHKDK